jgi:hypothetical protein
MEALLLPLITARSVVRTALGSSRYKVFESGFPKLQEDLSIKGFILATDSRSLKYSADQFSKESVAAEANRRGRSVQVLLNHVTTCGSPGRFGRHWGLG